MTALSGSGLVQHMLHNVYTWYNIKKTKQLRAVQIALLPLEYSVELLIEYSTDTEESGYN